MVEGHPPRQPPHGLPSKITAVLIPHLVRPDNRHVGHRYNLPRGSRPGVDISPLSPITGGLSNVASCSTHARSTVVCSSTSRQLVDWLP